MLLEEFDVDKYERSLKEEGREEGIEVGKEIGKETGKKDTRRQIIRNMLARGMSDEDIMALAECSQEEVDKVCQSMSSKIQ
jgi:predicted transposase YdaD